MVGSRPSFMLPLPNPSIADLPPDHIIHGEHKVFSHGDKHLDIAEFFLTADCAHPSYWPKNAACWGMVETYPTPYLPLQPTTVHGPLAGHSYSTTIRHAYPAFMYSHPMVHCMNWMDVTKTTYVYHWSVDTVTGEAILSECRGCKTLGLEWNCTVKGVVIPFGASGVQSTMPIKAGVARPANELTELLRARPSIHACEECIAGTWKKNAITPYAITPNVKVAKDISLVANIGAPLRDASEDSTAVNRQRDNADSESDLYTLLHGIQCELMTVTSDTKRRRTKPTDTNRSKASASPNTISLSLSYPASYRSDSPGDSARYKGNDFAKLPATFVPDTMTTENYAYTALQLRLSIGGEVATTSAGTAIDSTCPVPTYNPHETIGPLPRRTTSALALITSSDR